MTDRKSPNCSQMLPACRQGEDILFLGRAHCQNLNNYVSKGVFRNRATQSYNTTGHRDWCSFPFIRYSLDNRVLLQRNSAVCVQLCITIHVCVCVCVSRFWNRFYLLTEQISISKSRFDIVCTYSQHVRIKLNFDSWCIQLHITTLVYKLLIS